MAYEIPLIGVRGDNPMGMLVALGVFDTVCRLLDSEARLSWREDELGWHAVLSTTAAESPGQLAEHLGSGLPTDDVSQLKSVASDLNKVTPDDLRSVLSNGEFTASYMLSGLATEFPLRPDGQAPMTSFSLISFRGTRSFFDAVRRADEALTVERIESLLSRPWTYSKGVNSLNLNPAARIQDSARMAPNASADGTRGVAGSLSFAFRGLPLVPPLPTRGRRARVIACQTRPSSSARSSVTFTWPIWIPGLSRFGVEAMMGRNWDSRRGQVEGGAHGIAALFASEIVATKDGRRLAYPTRLA